MELKIDNMRKENDEWDIDVIKTEYDEDKKLFLSKFNSDKFLKNYTYTIKRCSNIFGMKIIKVFA